MSSTDLIGLNFSSSSTLTSALASSSTTTVSSAASSTDSSSTGGLAIQGDSDDKKFSKGAEMMQKLKDLQSSDPEKFKQVAQTISDKLTAAAKDNTDSKAAAMESKMAEKFAEAAKSGSMSSLTPPERPTGTAGAAGAQGTAAQKYAQASGGTNPMENLDSIISSAISGAGSTEA